MSALQKRIDALSALGDYIKSRPEELAHKVKRAFVENRWFEEDNTWKSLDAIAHEYLNSSKLANWLATYKDVDEVDSKRIALILAGNIPLVGFHDIITVFVSGHQLILKCSEKDKVLPSFLIEQLNVFYPDAAHQIQIVDRLENYDAVIATGSNSTSIHFEYYFRNYPKIIRKNRNGVAILTGKETAEDLLLLGEDIFAYFGLGCRNVSKLYVPKDYKFDFFLKTLHDSYKELVLHDKYKNNYDYNYAIYLLNQDPFLANGCLIVKEHEQIASRIASLNYEYYDSIEHVADRITAKSEEIQCVISQTEIKGIEVLPFGTAQKPRLDQYADGVDTMKFLLELPTEVYQEK